MLHDLVTLVSLMNAFEKCVAGLIVLASLGLAIYLPWAIFESLRVANWLIEEQEGPPPVRPHADYGAYRLHSFSAPSAKGLIGHRFNRQDFGTPERRSRLHAIQPRRPS